MHIIPPSLDKHLDELLNILSKLSKLGVFTGGTCVIMYSLRVGHFPQGLSIGDSMLLFMAAICFGMVYLFFTASLVALGMIMSPLIKVILKIISTIVQLSKKRTYRQPYELSPIEWPYSLLSLFAIFLIYIFGKNDPTAYWNLPLVSITLYLLYSAYQTNNIKLKKIRSCEKSIIHSHEKTDTYKLGSSEKITKNQFLILVFILTLPLIIGGVSGQLLDAAMRAAHVRIDNAVIYVKKPYSSLIHSSLLKNNKNKPVGYDRFESVSVLLRGFGKESVIQFKGDDIIKTIEIPNESLIIEDVQLHKKTNIKRA